MKKLIKNIFIVLLSFITFVSFISIHTLAETNELSYFKSYEKIIEIMKEDTNNLSKSNDLNSDFLYTMIINNKVSVSMLENIIKFGENSNIKSFAKSSLKEELLSNERIEYIIANLGEDSIFDLDKQQNYNKLNNEIYIKAENEMEKYKDRKNINKSFLKSFIAHNEGVIKMCDNILKYTNNNEVEEVATNIKNIKSKQIEKMKKIFKSV
ncbi:DUF305 domain-containing protein [Clostridium weizhouense]|uniref:DUF305 domain-containing protein n=1 Tax=Clostridium weizhouense TaxID=2859781 RepID=A0ABS7ALQ6_9CLOT|nr:DUF305 domain-containing protein [Clostridium weizhouense]MBW6409589.1 DUF305 domain-containing protein [Clostridium weizhouense]